MVDDLRTKIFLDVIDQYQKTVDTKDDFNGFLAMRRLTMTTQKWKKLRFLRLRLKEVFGFADEKNNLWIVFYSNT